MRRLTALAGLVMVAALAGCSGSSAKDPYQLVFASRAAEPDVMQVKIGLATVGGSTPIAITPDAFKITTDKTSGKLRIQVDLPTSALGIAASELQALGVTGDSITLDVLYDGDGLYANSPLLSTGLSMLMTQLGQTPPANLSGWLKLGTKTEFEALAAGLGASAGASMAPFPSITDGASLKTQLEAYGISLTYAGAESRNGVDADHVTMAIDLKKLAQNPALGSLNGTQLGQVGAMADQVTVTADWWLDKASGRTLEIDAHIAPTGSVPSSEPSRVEVIVQFGTPDAGTTFDAPATFTEVPLAPLFQALIQQFGKGLFTP
jgi:hypothetical protein